MGKEEGGKGVKGEGGKRGKKEDIDMFHWYELSFANRNRSVVRLVLEIAQVNQKLAAIILAYQGSIGHV